MRIDARSIEEYPWYLYPFFRHQRRKYGAVLNAALIWARVPKLFLTVALLYGALDRKSSPLEPELRSLVTILVSQINWCSFCVDINSATLLDRGADRDVSIVKLEAMAAWRDNAVYDGRERVALEYAEAMTRSDLDVDEALVLRLKQHFDDDALVELTALIAFQNMSSKFNNALAVPSQGFCRLPGTPPITEGAGSK